MIKFVDMFSGIGGFREGLTRAGGFECVGHCEIDKYANRSYNALFDTKGEWFIEDARKADPSTMPDFQLLCGGFPCQTFSIAGSRKGFGDPRGTLFFELARLAEARKPSYLLFENVQTVSGMHSRNLQYRNWCITEKADCSRRKVNSPLFVLWTALLQKVKKQRIIKARKGGAYPMQQEENYLAQSISQVDADARYDEGVKRLLANKSILAVIMKECVPEYHGCTVREIAEKYIEGEPQIGAVGVDADETNRNVSATIHGTNTEDVTLTEGTIRYDVRFYATAPSEDGLIGLILNVEAQNRYNAGYPLLKRAIYYCSRMISAQYGTEFTKGEYGKIKKVYSIWVCMNPPKNRRNTITQYSIQEKHIIGDAVEQVRNYDLMSAVMICLGDEDDKNYGGLLKFLEVLLSEEKSPETKKEILETEFDVPMTQTLESEVRRMCNLSQGVMERAMEKGVAKGIGIGEERGENKATLNAIRNVMDSFKVSVDAAMDALHIPEADRAKYRAMLQS